MNAMAPESLSDMAARASKLMPHRDFLQAAQAEKSDITASRLGCRRRAPRRQGPAGQMEDRDVPRRRAGNDRIDAPCLFDGPINGERFRAYVDQFLAPTLKPGDVVILDNLGSHKGKAVRKAIRDVGARLVFLPKYSPDLNPIEQVFAKFKTLLRWLAREVTKPSPTCPRRNPRQYPLPNAPHTSKSRIGEEQAAGAGASSSPSSA